MSPDQDWRDGWVTSQDNLRLYYRDYGDPNAAGPTVLCLGGLTRNSKDFDLVARRLAAKRRVLCPDYRGRGRSDYDSDWRRYQPATYLGDIRHLLVATNTHRVVVIGTSMGGLLATALAVAMPAVLAGAVLNDVGPEIDREAVARIVQYVGRDQPQPDWDSAVAYLKMLLPKLGLDSEADWLRFARNTYREGEDGRLHFDWDVRLARPLAKAGAPPPDLWRLFRALGALPVAAIRGENSDVLAPETFARMGQALPQIATVTIPGKGHAPTLEEGPAADAIDDILERAAE